MQHAILESISTESIPQTSCKPWNSDVPVSKLFIGSCKLLEARKEANHACRSATGNPTTNYYWQDVPPPGYQRGLTVQGGKGRRSQVEAWVEAETVTSSQGPVTIFFLSLRSTISAPGQKFSAIIAQRDRLEEW